MHPDSTYESDRPAASSLDFWRRQPTEDIIRSLRPDAKYPLAVDPHGLIWQGNTRIKVLQERGVDVNSLPRVPHNQGQTTGGGAGW